MAMTVPDRPRTRRPRPLTIVVVGVIVLIVAAALLATPPAWFPNAGPAAVSIEPTEAPGGQVTMFTITVAGGRGGRLSLETTAIAIEGGMARSELNWSFPRSPWSIGLLPSPFANSTNLTVQPAGAGPATRIAVTVTPAGTGQLVDGGEALDRERRLTDPASGYIRRVTGHPNLERAARFFEGEFRSFGLETRLDRYPLSAGLLDPWGRVVVNVVATKWGADRSRWIVLGAHFDSASTTIQGAYDDGLGSNIVVTLAKSLAAVETNHTIVFVLFSGEEEGLQGSEEYVKTIPSDVTVTAYLNHDMVGINWPAPFTFHALIGPDEDDTVVEHPELVNLTFRAVHDFLGLPREEFNVTEHPRTRSDHVSFWSIGTSTVNFKGGMDAYPGYHTPDDTFDNMVQVSGGEDVLRQSIHHQLWISVASILLLDDSPGPM